MASPIASGIEPVMLLLFIILIKNIKAYSTKFQARSTHNRFNFLADPMVAGIEPTISQERASKSSSLVKAVNNQSGRLVFKGL